MVLALGKSVKTFKVLVEHIFPPYYYDFSWKNDKKVFYLEIIIISSPTRTWVSY